MTDTQILGIIYDQQNTTQEFFFKVFNLMTPSDSE